MANEIHKGNELRNVSETWDANEKERQQQQPDRNAEEVPAASELDRVVRDEASEYDRTSSDEKLQSGERGSVKDEGVL